MGSSNESIRICKGWQVDDAAFRQQFPPMALNYDLTVEPDLYTVKVYPHANI